MAPKVGQVEVYKVNHHGSRYSSNPLWLATVQPKIGIISCGNDNEHGHPARECLARLHDANIETYWTERGKGVAPVSGLDTVGGNIIVEIVPGATAFTVTYSGNEIKNYTVWNPVGTSGANYSWSKRASVYHFSNCRYVENISPGNLERGTAPAENRTLHVGCPKR